MWTENWPYMAGGDHYTQSGRFFGDSAECNDDIVRILPREQAAEAGEGVADDTKLTLDLLASQGVSVENGFANWQVSLNETLSWSPDDGDDIPWGNGRMTLLVDGPPGQVSVDLDWPETVGQLRPFGRIFRFDALPNEVNAQRAECARRVAAIGLEFLEANGEKQSPTPPDTVETTASVISETASGVGSSDAPTGVDNPQSPAPPSAANAGPGCDLENLKNAVSWVLRGAEPLSDIACFVPRDRIQMLQATYRDLPLVDAAPVNAPESQEGELSRVKLLISETDALDPRRGWVLTGPAAATARSLAVSRFVELTEAAPVEPASPEPQGVDECRRLRRELDAAVFHHEWSMKAIDLSLGEPRYDDGSLLDCFLRRIAELQPSPPPSLPASDAPAAVIGGPGRHRMEWGDVVTIVGPAGEQWVGYFEDRYGNKTPLLFNPDGTRDHTFIAIAGGVTGPYVEPPKPPVPVLVIEEKSRVYGWVVAWSMFDKSFPAGQWLVDGGLLVQPIKALKGDMVVGYCDHVGLDMPKIRLYVHYDGPCMFLEEDWPRVQELVAQVNAVGKERV